ncbi:hypothetical protein V2J09_010669 [Rumex salicifolius]
MLDRITKKLIGAVPNNDEDEVDLTETQELPSANHDPSNFTLELKKSINDAYDDSNPRIRPPCPSSLT